MKLVIANKDFARLSKDTVIACIQDGAPAGKKETPENGFSWIELTGLSEEECREFFDGVVVQEEMLGERLVKVSEESPIPIHPRAARSMHRKVKGRTIAKHLKNGCVQMRRKGLVTYVN